MKLKGKLADLLAAPSTSQAKKKRVNVYVTANLYDSFKKTCEAKGLAVSHVLDAFMEDFVAEQGSKRPRG